MLIHGQKHFPHSQIEHIVFDFDGTLVLSNEGKRKAFFKIFEHIPKSESVVRNVLEDNPEISRNIVIPIICKKLNLPKSSYEIMIQAYTNISIEVQKMCSEAGDINHFLSKLMKKYFLHVSSNSDELDLREVISKRGWSKYFTSVNGHPKSKIETISQILKNYNVLGPNLVIIGDGKSDRLSALHHKCYFIQINKNLTSQIGCLL